jgi:class 3 adenylate cyclase
MPETPQTMKRLNAADDLVTRAFLFTDVEGSSRLMEEDEAACKEALAHHDAMLRRIAAAHGGRELAEAGDGFLFVFERPEPALKSGLELQRQIEATRWPLEAGRLRVRVALGWGEVTSLESGEFRGLILNRTARLLGAIHGGQIVCGIAFVEASWGAHRDSTNSGWYHLRDLAEPERVFQVQPLETARQIFPPLRANPVVPSNLPRTFTRFFGREEEIARVCELLRAKPGAFKCNQPRDAHRPRWHGKTRLSIAVAEQLRDGLAEAVWFVPLPMSRTQR